MGDGQLDNAATFQSRRAEAAQQNEPIVFLPGMMCDARLFGSQIKEFGRNRPIHLPTLSLDDSIEAMAQRVLAHAPPVFALAGLSLGGIVAMEVIRQAPTRVSRLALLDTNALPELPAKAAEREPQIARVLSGRLLDVMRDEMKPNYLAPGPARQHVMDLVLEMAVELGEGPFVRQSRALQRRPDQQATLRRIAVPTLVLCGEEDELCPPERHEFMSSLIPRSRLVIVPDAGHMPTLEQPELTNAALGEWLLS